MKHATMITLLVLFFLSAGCDSGTKGTRGARNAKTELTQADAAYVPAVCQLMREAGFKQISGVPLDSETAFVDRKTIQADGATYEWTALTYRGSNGDRVVARRLTKNGQAAPRLDELKLVLANQIPLAVHSGWLKSRDHGSCLAFDYTKLSKIIKNETVATLPDGRVIKHIVKEGLAPYFAVETIRKVKKPYSVTVTLTPEGDYCGVSNPRWRTLDELKSAGQLPSDAVSMNKVGEENQKSDSFCVMTRTYLVMCEREETETSMTAYPYYED